MKVQLEQAEIEIAVQDYVSKLGISLKGLNVQIDFTAGRQGGRGLTADLDITEGSDIPGFSNPAPEEAPAPLAVVKTDAPVPVRRSAKRDIPEYAVEPEPTMEAAPEVVKEAPPEVAEAAPAAKTTSLFAS